MRGRGRVSLPCSKCNPSAFAVLTHLLFGFGCGRGASACGGSGTVTPTALFVSTTAQLRNKIATATTLGICASTRGRFDPCASSTVILLSSATTFSLGGSALSVALGQHVRLFGASSTIIDAGGLSRALEIINGVVVVDGLTIKNGVGADGGCVSLKATALSATHKAKARFYLKRGTLTSCTATNDGGAVHAPSGGALDMTNFEATALNFVALEQVSITACTAARSGGAVFFASINAYFKAVSFISCSAAAGDGGALMLSQPQTVEVLSSSFTSCTAMSGKGGALSASGAGVSSIQVEDTTATACVASQGGAVSVQGASIKLKRSVLTTCAATLYSASSWGGGCISASGAASVQLEETNVTGGSAMMGGCIGIAGSSLTMKQATLDSCQSQFGGTSIAASDSTTVIHMSDSRIVNGMGIVTFALVWGPNIALVRRVSLTVLRSVFEDNFVRMSSATGPIAGEGGVFGVYDSKLIVKDSAFRRNEARNGAIIAVCEGSSISIQSSVFEDNMPSTVFSPGESDVHALITMTAAVQGPLTQGFGYSATDVAALAPPSFELLDVTVKMECTGSQQAFGARAGPAKALLSSMKIPLRNVVITAKGCGSRAAERVIGLPQSSVVPCVTSEGTPSTFTNLESGNVATICGTEAKCTASPMLVDADSPPNMGTTYQANSGLTDVCELGSPIPDQAECVAASAAMARQFHFTVDAANAAQNAWAFTFPPGCFFYAGMDGNQGLYHIDLETNQTMFPMNHFKVCKLDTLKPQFPDDASLFATPTCTCDAATCKCACAAQSAG